jgi:hypothetical protein
MSVKVPRLVIVGLLSGVSAAPAASVTVSDTASGLPGVALDAIAMLVDAGLPLRSSGGGKLTVEVKGFHPAEWIPPAPEPALHPRPRE